MFAHALALGRGSCIGLGGPSLLALCVLSSYLFSTMPAHAQYHPEHPDVKTMVNRAITYLETSEDRRSVLGEYAEGGPILVGYTVYKVTGDDAHPLVKQGLNKARELCGNLNKRRHGSESKIVYEASIACVFLCSVDAAQYDDEIRETLFWFEQVQKNHGGFGYLGRSTGDTSQVQYVMLALWTMKEVGIDVPPGIVEGAIRYLKSTMDPSGAWGYQGRVSNGGLVKQEKVSKSLATAGLGALIIGGDVLNLYGERDKSAKNKEDGIPEVFRRVDLEARKKRNMGVVTMTRADTDGAVKLGINYQVRNNFSGMWFYYWLYSQERYESFVEIVNDRQEKSPPWYNAGVKTLMKIQGPDGEWGSTASKSDHTPPHVSTALAVLYLIRSTQKSIGKLNEGLTVGFDKFPMDVTNVRPVGNSLVSDQEATVNGILKMLEDGAVDGIDSDLIPKDLQLTDDPKQRKEQINRLSRLLTGPSWAARRVAAKLLGRAEQIDVVPDLIYALSDDDPIVPMVAEESLRLISRKLTAGDLKKQPSGEDRTKAIKYWKEWYLGLRPDYIFVDAR